MIKLTNILVERKDRWAKYKISNDDRVIISNDEKIIFSQKQIVKIYKELSEFFHPIDFKPVGLWYSIGSEWIDFLRGERYVEKNKYSNFYKAHAYNNVFKIYINESKILHINNKQQFEEFYEKYKSPFDPTSTFGKQQFKKPDDSRWYINWALVSKEYSGIEITPYQSWARMKYIWYYPWDIAQGCIWKKDAIKKITRLKYD